MKTSHSLSEDAPEPRSLSRLDSNGLCLELFRQRDRYHHRIVAADGTPLLTSIEGNDQDDWPPSPPLQQLSIEEIRPGVEVALLVGMAGKSHWSVSIEPQLDHPGFIFDVACRIAQSPTCLGSRYDLHASDATPVQLTGLDVGHAATQVDSGSARWTVAPDDNDKPGTTVRWKYSISLR